MIDEEMLIEVTDEKKFIKTKVRIEELVELVLVSLEGRRKDGKEAGRKTEGRKTER